MIGIAGRPARPRPGPEPRPWLAPAGEHGVAVAEPHPSPATPTVTYRTNLPDACLPDPNALHIRQTTPGDPIAAWTRMPRCENCGAAHGHARAARPCGYGVSSAKPVYGTSASGIRTDPSAC